MRNYERLGYHPQALYLLVYVLDLRPTVTARDLKLAYLAYVATLVLVFYSKKYPVRVFLYPNFAGIALLAVMTLLSLVISLIFGWEDYIIAGAGWILAVPLFLLSNYLYRKGGDPTFDHIIKQQSGPCGVGVRKVTIEGREVVLFYPIQMLTQKAAIESGQRSIPYSKKTTLPTFIDHLDVPAVSKAKFNLVRILLDKVNDKRLIPIIFISEDEDLFSASGLARDFASHGYLLFVLAAPGLNQTDEAKLKLMKQSAEDLISQFHDPGFLKSHFNFPDASRVMIDQTKVIVAGAGLGGTAAIQLAQANKRIAACLPMNPQVVPSFSKGGPLNKMPILILTTEDYFSLQDKLLSRAEKPTEMKKQPVNKSSEGESPAKRELVSFLNSSILASSQNLLASSFELGWIQCMTLTDTTQVSLSDKGVLLLLEMHFVHHGFSSLLPESLEAMAKRYLLNAWLQLSFLHTAELGNGILDIHKVKQKLAMMEEKQETDEIKRGKGCWVEKLKLD